MDNVASQCAGLLNFKAFLGHIGMRMCYNGCISGLGQAIIYVLIFSH